MTRFATAVTQIDGRKINIIRDVYYGLPNMADAAARAAMDECASSGDVAHIAVSTRRGRIKLFEVTVQHQITTTIKLVGGSPDARKRRSAQ